MSIKMRKTNLHEYKVREDLDRILHSRSWLFTIHTGSNNTWPNSVDCLSLIHRILDINRF